MNNILIVLSHPVIHLSNSLPIFRIRLDAVFLGKHFDKIGDLDVSRIKAVEFFSEHTFKSASDDTDEHTSSCRRKIVERSRVLTGESRHLNRQAISVNRKFWRNIGRAFSQETLKKKIFRRLFWETDAAGFFFPELILEPLG